MIFTAGIFQSYSSIGRLKTLGTDSSSIYTMNLDQFITFCQDHICLNHLWTKDIKAVFEEIKYRDDEQITFEQFLDGLQLISRIVLKHESYGYNVPNPRALPKIVGGNDFEGTFWRQECLQEEIRYPICFKPCNWRYSTI
jgi:hypothetical protein